MKAILAPAIFQLYYCFPLFPLIRHLLLIFYKCSNRTHKNCTLSKLRQRFQGMDSYLLSGWLLKVAF